MFSLAPLLIHSDEVPPSAQNALRAALFGPPEHRKSELVAAARSLFNETGLECDEVRDLVGLPATCEAPCS